MKFNKQAIRVSLWLIGLMVLFWAGDRFLNRGPVSIDTIAEDLDFSGGSCVTEDAGKIAIDKAGHYFECSEKLKWEPLSAR